MCSGTGCGRAVGAEAPVDDLGLVDREAMVVGRGQARCIANRAIGVGDDAAAAADDVVMVVRDSRLIAGHRARRLYAPYQAHSGQRSEHVVNGLMGQFAEILTRNTDDPVRIGMRMRIHRG